MQANLLPSQLRKTLCAHWKLARGGVIYKRCETTGKAHPVQVGNEAPVKSEAPFYDKPQLCLFGAYRIYVEISDPQ